MTAIQLLKQDHAKVLFGEFARSAARAVKTRQRLADQIATELDVHATIEAEIFYPAVRRVGSLKAKVQEALKEHAEAKRLVAEIRIRKLHGSDEGLEDRIRELRDAVLHHATEEEKEMFPEVQGVMGASDLKRLGEALARRKAELSKAKRAA